MDYKSGVYCGSAKLRFSLTEPLAFPKKIEVLRKRRWADLLENQPASFDGELLGLERLDARDSEIHVVCRKVAYSSYILTRDINFDRQYPKIEKADPIGVTVIVIFDDETVLCSTRSKLAEQNPGALYFVGGYASYPSDEGRIDLIVDGKRELREETNINNVDDSRSVLLGISYDPVFFHPEVTVLLFSSGIFDDERRRIDSAVDAWEAEAYFAVPLQDLVNGEFPPEINHVRRTWSFDTSLSFLKTWVGSTRGHCK